MKEKEQVHRGEHFEPIAYRLNWPTVDALGITITDESGSPARTTVGAILREAIPWRFTGDGAQAIPEVDDEHDTFDIATPTRVIKVDRLYNLFPAQVLHLVLRLWRMENGTHYVRLLFYGKEFDEDAERYRFFAVVGDNIVEESLELSFFHDDDDDDVDKNILKPAWYFEDESWKTPGNDTHLRWWYRRFYTETRAGRCMVLRTDEPHIFHYEPPEHREATNAKHLAQIARATSWIAFATSVAVLASLLRLVLGRG